MRSKADEILVIMNYIVFGYFNINSLLSNTKVSEYIQ